MNVWASRDVTRSHDDSLTGEWRHPKARSTFNLLKLPTILLAGSARRQSKLNFVGVCKQRATCIAFSDIWKYYFLLVFDIQSCITSLKAGKNRGTFKMQRKQQFPRLVTLSVQPHDCTEISYWWNPGVTEDKNHKPTDLSPLPPTAPSLTFSMGGLGGWLSSSPPSSLLSLGGSDRFEDGRSYIFAMAGAGNHAEGHQLGIGGC